MVTRSITLATVIGFSMAVPAGADNCPSPPEGCPGNELGTLVEYGAELQTAVFPPPWSRCCIRSSSPVEDYQLLKTGGCCPGNPQTMTTVTVPSTTVNASLHILDGTSPGNNNLKGLAGWTVRDLRFESIDDPGGGGSIQVQLAGQVLRNSNAYYTSSEGCSPGGPQGGPPPGTPTAGGLSGAVFLGGATLLEFDASTVPPGGWTTVTGPLITVPLDAELTLHLDLWVATLVAAVAPPSCGDQVSHAESTVTFNPGGPAAMPGNGGGVFILPPGYTANAPSIGLVNNNFVASCPWDCGDSDGNVGIVDFLALLADWGTVDTPCDFDSGGVGITDFLALLANWGACP